MTDESEDREHAKVGAAFAALRETDAQKAPSFDATWARAERSLRERRARRATGAIGAVLGGAAVAAAAGAVVVLWPSGERENERTAAAAVASMRDAPLEFLLTPPSDSVVSARVPFAIASPVTKRGRMSW